MANDYLEFSEVVTDLTDEEFAWLKEQLEFIYVFGEHEYRFNSLPSTIKPEEADWAGCRALRDMPGYEPDVADETAGFCYQLCDNDQQWGRCFWVYADEYACVDRVVHVVQKFLKTFRPNQSWSLTYATTCSQLRVGAFGGGAVLVTAHEIKWHDAHDFVNQQKAQLDNELATESESNAGVAALSEFAASKGLEPTDLDELVHEAASAHASEINNGGLERQIAFLVDELGPAVVQQAIQTAGENDVAT